MLGFRSTAALLVATLAMPLAAHADGHIEEAVVALGGDVEAGEKVFRKCKACHQVGEGAKNRVGPILTGIVGKVAGQNADFKYSDAMAAKGEEGMEWTVENLSAFLEKPRDFVKGTKMSFPGLKKEDERANVITYLFSVAE